MSSFNDFGLSTAMCSNLNQLGFAQPTEIQAKAIAPGLAGKDIIAMAKTGSGKTAAFGISLVERLNPRLFAVQALVLCPTRELADQVAKAIRELARARDNIKVLTLCGGVAIGPQIGSLSHGAHIVVGTPGRIQDHLRKQTLTLARLKTVVLDEADRMLDMGFQEAMEDILSQTPPSRQTMMFSATWPAPIRELSKQYQKSPVDVRAEDTGDNPDIEELFYEVSPQSKSDAIVALLSERQPESCIVFCTTKQQCDDMAAELGERGFSALPLHGDLEQRDRDSVLVRFGNQSCSILVATDVAARGIDLPNLELVIHADLPSNSDTLLHRSGRTGRAGRKGVSALIVPAKLRSKANRLIGGAKLKVEWAAPPSAAEVNAADEARLLADSAWSDPIPEDAEGFVANLVEQFSAEQLATAFVNLYRARQSAPEELAEPGAPGDDKPRPAFGKSVWFSISTGRNDGAEPRTLLPMLCRRGDLTKDDIGAIRVQGSHSFVEVLETSVPGLLAALGGDMKLEEGAVLTQLDKAPDLARGPKPGGNRGPKPGGGYKGDRPDRGPRPPRDNYDPDAAPAPRKPRAKAADGPGAASFDKPKFDKPKFDKPRAPKGERPPKSHKTERSPMKPGAAPKPKSGGETTAKPKAKAVWKKEKPAGDAPRKAKGKPTSSATTPGGEKSYKRASDPSKRFTPPNKIGKQGGKGGPKSK